jgi:molybdenum cofactor synthesis domain-containing protein
LVQGESILKKVRVEDAVGMVLGHDVTKIVPGGFKGAAFKKGHVIRQEDMEELKSMGKNHINIIELECGQIHENEAAERISRACAGENIELKGPSEGKIEFISRVRGVLKVNVDALDRINDIEEIALASVHSNTLVEVGQPVAATRTIPLVIDEGKIKSVELIAGELGSVIAIREMKKGKIGVVISGTEVYEGRIKDRFAPVMEEKIKFYGCESIGIRYAPDDSERLQREITKLIECGADVVLACGGMSVDADDVTPDAIKQSSDYVVSYGMPALPGNMLMLAYKGKTAIFGIPGAAMYFRTTTLDLLLPRVLCGEILTRKDLTSMGNGGYCLRCKVCVFPACPFGK